MSTVRVVLADDHAVVRAGIANALKELPDLQIVGEVGDGRGMAADFDLATLAAMGHYGLLGISERIALLKGRLQVQNRPDGGLLLQVEIPHSRVEVQTAALA